MNYNVILFDLDGTLLDTGEGIVRALKQTLEEFQIPPQTEKVLRQFVGPPLHATLKKTFKLQDTAVERIVARFRTLYGTQYISCAQIYPGIKSLLIELKHHGAKLGVATYKREDLARSILSLFGLLPYFETVVGGDQSGQYTKADILRLCKSQISSKGDCIVMVGDTASDRDAAQVEGMAFIGVSYGYGFKPEQQENKRFNERIVSSVEELRLELLEGHAL